jgi:UPF0755 protein
MDEISAKDKAQNFLLKARLLAEQHQKKILITLLSVCAIFLITYLSIWRTPSNFPVYSIVSVKSGESLEVVTQKFTSLHMIRSPFVFRSLVILLGGEKKVTAGDYLLASKESPLTLAWRIIKGEFGMDPVKVTIFEGLNITEIGELLSKNLISFDIEAFKEEAKDKEGYLFPDTYFLPPTAKPSDVIDRMEENFNEKIKSLEPDIEKFGKPLEEIITMASIIEGEARGEEAQKMVAGILWKRISIGMPLQVDATFKYINGKDSFTLSYADLKEDSPYNTYTNKGLPPGPINNPGFDSIHAALNPTKTDYLYFLTGNDGNMYYGKTFEQHKLNKAKYLVK